MMFAVGVPLLGGVLLGHPVAGVAGGSTALFVTMSDIGDTPRVRLGTMLAGWLAFVGGGTVGHLIGGTPNANEIGRADFRAGGGLGQRRASGHCRGDAVLRHRHRGRDRDALHRP